MPCRLNWRLTSISKEGDLFVLAYDTPDGGVSIRARSVAMTAPSYVVADLLKDQCVSATVLLQCTQILAEGLAVGSSAP